MARRSTRLPELGTPTYTDQTVYEAALDRLRICFDRYDHVVVSFSGGKDSTVVLQLALEVAREKGRLPLDVMHFDEEAIPEPTAEYIRRLMRSPELRIRWYCLPVKHRNACSRTEPWWHCWDPAAEDRWVRPMPAEGITDMPGFQWGMDVTEAAALAYADRRGSVCQVLGIRAQESLRRRRIVSLLRQDNWLSMTADNTIRAFPIYDWMAEDVWVAPARYGWDYNTTYDVYEAAGVPLAQQRVCPPFGEEPLEKLHTYAVTFPELWAKMIDRVHGAATAARYAGTEIYGARCTTPPDGMTWQEYTHIVLSYYPPLQKKQVTESINLCIATHNRKSKLEIHDSEPDPLSGISWKFLCRLALRGDFKQRTAANMGKEATKARDRVGLSFEDAIRDHGTGLWT